MDRYKGFKYFAIIQYLERKNIDNGYMSKRDNYYCIYYLACYRHLISWGHRDLQNRTLYDLQKLSANNQKTEFDKYFDAFIQIVPEKDFSEHLSESDEQSLDWAIDTVDTYTYNFD